MSDTPELPDVSRRCWVFETKPLAEAAMNKHPRRGLFIREAKSGWVISFHLEGFLWDLEKPESTTKKP